MIDMSRYLFSRECFFAAGVDNILYFSFALLHLLRIMDVVNTRKRIVYKIQVCQILLSSPIFSYQYFIHFQ